MKINELIKLRYDLIACEKALKQIKKIAKEAKLCIFPEEILPIIEIYEKESNKTLSI